jgi:hypothetical protein
MPEKLGEAVLELTVDGERYTYHLGNAEKQAGKLQDKFNQISTALTSTGKKMLTSLTLPIVGLGAAMLKASSDLNESLNAINVVFKDSAGVIEEFGRTADIAAGLSQNAFNQIATVLGSQLKQAGIPLSEVADRTIELTQRGADLASVFNVEVKESMTALGAALRGESEPARRFGVNISDAAVQAEALASGLVKSKDEITDQIKILARYNLIMKQSADVAGDFSNTSDQLANRTRILKSRLVNIGASLKDVLLPVAERVVTSLGKMVEWFAGLSTETKVTVLKILAVVAAIGPLLIIAGKLVKIIGTLKVAFAAFNIAMLANPYVIAAAAAVALGVAIFNLTKRFREEEKIRESLLEKQRAGTKLTEEERMTLAEIELARLRSNKALAQENLLKAQSMGLAPNVIAALQKNVDGIQAEISAKVLELRSLGAEISVRQKQIDSINAGTEAITESVDTTKAKLLELGKIKNPLAGFADEAKYAFGELEKEMKRVLDYLDDYSKYVIQESEKLSKEIEKIAAKNIGQKTLGKASLIAEGEDVNRTTIPDMTGTASKTGADTGITKILSSAGSALSSFGGALLAALGSLQSVQMILNPISTILSAAMKVLEPVVNNILSPLIGALTILGTLFGAVLTPVLEILTPIIKLVSEAFVWLYNKVIMPIANGLITVFGKIQNGLAKFVNAILSWVNKTFGKSLTLMTVKDYTTTLLEEINYDPLVSAGNESTTNSASYEQVRPIENNFYIEGNNFNGAGGLREFVLTLYDEWKDANALGLT